MKYYLIIQLFSSAVLVPLPYADLDKCREAGVIATSQPGANSSFRFVCVPHGSIPSWYAK